MPKTSERHASSGGGVTSVTASDGLASSGGATPDITIPGPIPHDLELRTTSTIGPNLILNNTNTSGAEWRVKSSASADPSGAGAFAIQSHTDGTTPFTILPATNYVGINTTTPDSALTINGSLHILSSTETVYDFSQQLVGTTAVQWIPNSGFVFKYGSTGSAGDRVFISKSGAVGIGSFPPSHKLDVNGDFRCVNDANLNANVQIGGWTAFASSAEHVVDFGQQIVGTTAVQWIPSGGLDFKHAATGLAGRLNVMSANGDFGLNMVPAYKLDVTGSVRINGDIGFFNTTPQAQQTGGAQTAGIVYTATEQDMLQKAYDALRTFGFLS